MSMPLLGPTTTGQLSKELPSMGVSTQYNSLSMCMRIYTRLERCTLHEKKTMML